MFKIFLYLALMALTIILPLTVLADVSVSTNVSTDANNGGSASVSVQNSVHSSSSSSTNTSVHKRIEINVNGQQKVVDSDQPGNTSVQVNSNNDAAPTIIVTETPATPAASPSAMITPLFVSKRQDINKSIQELLNNIRKEIGNLLESLGIPR